MPYKILVTDDNTSVVEVLVKRLKQEGYEVISACDGAEAIEQIERENPDIILLDLMMPKINGFEVLQVIRKRRLRLLEQWRPVIVISAKDESEVMKEAGDEFNTVQYLSKPCSIADILAAVRNTAEMLERIRGNIRIRTDDGERPI